MQNIEFKAELRDLDAAAVQCEALGGAYIGRLIQTDTYFRLPDGRLKQREQEGHDTEWVFYHRLDRVRPRMSNYTILTDAQAKRRWGTHSLREWVRVHKTRDLWMLENVRVHLDAVDRLGTFLEFEAQVSRTYGVEACHRRLKELRDIFAPVLGEAVAVSYSDLMEQTLAGSGAEG